MSVLERSKRTWPALLAALLVFIGSATPAWTAEPTSFRVSYGGTAGYQLPLWVNKELGFSKKYGVDLEIILIQAGSPNIQALLGGSLQLTQTAASSAVIGANQGAPVVIVATLENKLPMLLISRPEIKEPQQLRGKVIGINRFGGSNDAAILMAVKAWKMQPSDIKMLQTGGTSARMAALMTKKVDATVQSYPEIYQARKMGMNVLADIGDFGFYTNTSNIVTRSYLKQNRAAIKGFHQGSDRRHALRQDQQRRQSQDSQETPADHGQRSRRGDVRVFRQALGAIAAHGAGRHQKHSPLDRSRPEKPRRLCRHEFDRRDRKRRLRAKTIWKLKSGVLECWSDGSETILQYSNTPSLHS